MKRSWVLVFGVTAGLAVNGLHAVWARAVEGGASVARPLADTFWGEREGQIVDPFGHRWGLSQHVRDVPLDEMSRAAAEVFGGSPGAATS